MSYFEKSVEKDISKYGQGFDTIHKFLGKSIEIQNNAYDAKYADRKYEYSKAVLKGIGVENEILGILEDAHNRALNEISEGIRIKPTLDYISEKNATSIKMNNKTGDLEITVKISKKDIDYLYSK